MAAFPALSFCYLLFMTKINVINCKTEEKTKAYTFAPLMFSESFLSDNLSIFEDLNVIQIGIEKINLRWKDKLTIWWGN